MNTGAPSTRPRRLQHDSAIEIARIQVGATLQAARLAHGADLPPSAT